MQNTQSPIITLCGSTRFPELWKRANAVLSIAGCIVLSVGMFGHLENLDMAGPVKKRLDHLHFQKIAISDAIFVLNKGGYIVLSTWDEIFFALANRVSVYFQEKLCEACAREFLALIDYENEDDLIYPLVFRDGTVRGANFREGYERCLHKASNYELRQALNKVWAD